ncbi:serine hydrolase domain-containing protein [Variovorax boronicumulans]|uniref:serine hydrolase domain-containing protein n=1 Tax=Variovorax boronicumulans TaxID=436515 RepID=UPI001C59E290
MSDTTFPSSAGRGHAAALDPLFQAFDRSDAPGLVVGVAQHGETFYRRGFGLASIEHAIANTPATRMAIGSSSKHFTSLAILLLAEDGKLDVDDDVRRHIPELPVLAGAPTLRQLMTHTGGHRCYLDLGLMSEGMALKPRGSALAAQVRQTRANFAPGEKMIYSNGGYHLLSIVIERVSGQGFEQFLTARIFGPMGMHDTVSVRSDLEIHRGMATLHVPREDGGWRRGIFPSEEMSGDGATITTVDDMLRWLAHLRAPGRVGREDTWRQMLTPATFHNGLVNHYALGLMRHDYRGVEVILHAGGVVGGNCQMITVPSQALDIILIANGVRANLVELSHRIIDIVLADAMPGRPVLGPPRRKASAARFAPMLGTRYHVPASGLLFGFAEAPGGALGLCFMNGAPQALWDKGEVLRLGLEDLAVGPLVLQAGDLALEGQPAPVALTLRESGHAEHGERLPDMPPSNAEAGAVLVGRYRAQDLEAQARVQLEGERLQLRIFGPQGSQGMALQAFSHGVFGWHTAQVDVGLNGALSVCFDAGRVAGFHLDSWRTRRMWFERIGD